ncbi:MAG: hypothetical protein P0Y53_05090 [Candidatus Pseudobacter hemicellulosilyticus]|uniref:DUF3575 domain-containing protein n=1 Tax=Candidatus Pseudobacter hemicellulosilyticus TaxID=3121375 RepID=A0AAJ5WTN5_9BACT|nr:MAG: hypothetical protein P0Y53_05090 [Pseudobacter sp.]
MKPTVLLLLILSFSAVCVAQDSDFIVLKKRNNRTLKTYAAGTFLNARTWNGFTVHGFISRIQNDSVYVRQQETRLAGTEFGSAIDTLYYTVGLDYRELGEFDYNGRYNSWGRKKGFTQITIPRLMMVGGVGFLVLEGINTAYRNESLTEDNKLVWLSSAAAVAAAGYMIERMKQDRNKVGKKIQVHYLKAGTIRFGR